jgi:hypothetical protein
MQFDQTLIDTKPNALILETPNGHVGNLSIPFRTKVLKVKSTNFCYSNYFACNFKIKTESNRCKTMMEKCVLGETK